MGGPCPAWLQAGLSPEQIDAIAERQTPEFDHSDGGLPPISTLELSTLIMKLGTSPFSLPTRSEVTSIAAPAILTF